MTFRTLAALVSGATLVIAVTTVAIAEPKTPAKKTEPQKLRGGFVVPLVALNKTDNSKKPLPATTAPKKFDQPKKR